MNPTLASGRYVCTVMHVGRAAFHGDTHIHSLNILLSILVSDILPVFLIAGAGFLLARKLQASVKTMSHVSFYALSPCLAFKMLATSKMTGSEAVRMVLMAVLVTAAMGLLARLAAIPLGLNRAELSGVLL